MCCSNLKQTLPFEGNSASDSLLQKYRFRSRETKSRELKTDSVEAWEEENVAQVVTDSKINYVVW